LRAGPEVRNFDQIEVGNSVVIHYKRSMAVSLVKPGESPAAASATVVAARAEKGAPPAAAIGGQVTATVKIESVDTAKNLVVFTDPSGGMHVVSVKRPEGKTFIQGLKAGDQVEITYTEAVAISVAKE
jgi:hypothetical protein